MSQQGQPPQTKGMVDEENISNLARYLEVKHEVASEMFTIKNEIDTGMSYSQLIEKITSILVPLSRTASEPSNVATSVSMPEKESPFTSPPDTPREIRIIRNTSEWRRDGDITPRLEQGITTRRGRLEDIEQQNKAAGEMYGL